MTAEENREKMPIIAAFVDSMREFFPDLKVTFAQENSITLGKRSEEREHG